MFGRGSLSSTAKEALKITRESCALGRDRAIVAAMLIGAGDEAPPTDAEFLVCRWPNESALLVAETFFEPAAPLTRLKFEHTRSKWAAVATYGRVQNTLLVWLEQLVSAPKYAKAMRYVREQYRDDAQLNQALALSRADLEETVNTGAFEDPLSAYVTNIYIRSILAEEFVPAYFTEESVEGAGRRVSLVLANAIRDLVGVG